MLRTILGWLTGGVLDRVLSTVDRKIQNETDREKIKGDIIRESYRSRGAWMRSGGFVLTLLFAIPLAFYWASVIWYSVFWCLDCAYPKPWTIAALPAPFDEWGWMIMVSIFGVLGVTQVKR